jgi:hypothetical protein
MIKQDTTMNAIYYDSLTLTKASSHQISISLEVVDKSSVTSRVVWQKTLPLYGFILLIILSIPFLLLLMLWTIADHLISIFTFSKREPTEIEGWFNIIAPVGKNLAVLKNELNTLKAKNWQELHK